MPASIPQTPATDSTTVMRSAAETGPAGPAGVCSCGSELMKVLDVDVDGEGSEAEMLVAGRDHGFTHGLGHLQEVVAVQGGGDPAVDAHRQATHRHGSRRLRVLDRGAQGVARRARGDLLD